MIFVILTWNFVDLYDFHNSQMNTSNCYVFNYQFELYDLHKFHNYHVKFYEFIDFHYYKCNFMFFIIFVYLAWTSTIFMILIII